MGCPVRSSKTSGRGGRARAHLVSCDDGGRPNQRRRHLAGRARQTENDNDNETQQRGKTRTKQRTGKRNRHNKGGGEGGLGRQTARRGLNPPYLMMIEDNALTSASCCSTRNSPNVLTARMANM